MILGFWYHVEGHAIAWTDWEAETPGGNTISDNWGPKALFVKDSVILSNLKEWYFYDRHMIGTYYSSPRESVLSYFIYNEFSAKLDTFAKEAHWTQQLQHQELQPVIWNRWHNNDWSSISLLDLMLSVGILVLLRVLLQLLSTRGVLKKGRSNAFFLVGVLIIILIVKIKLSFPDSF